MKYKDVIWHFSSRLSKLRGTVSLQVFSSDREYFVRSLLPSFPQSLPEAFPVSLPLQMSPESKPARTSMLSGIEAETLGAALFASLPSLATEPLLYFKGDASLALRIRISSDLPACDDLPWECLCSGSGEPRRADRALDPGATGYPSGDRDAADPRTLSNYESQR
jgi:hypothetical protein